MFSQQLAKLKNKTKIKTSLRARGPPKRSLRILRIGRLALQQGHIKLIESGNKDLFNKFYLK